MLRKINCLYNVNSVKFMVDARVVLVGLFRKGVVAYDCDTCDLVTVIDNTSGAIIGLDYGMYWVHSMRVSYDM